MTIRRGEPWGESVARPQALVLVDSDAELAAAVTADPARAYGLGGGDLFRSLGSPGDRDEMQRLPIDLMHVDADSSHHVAVAHVVVRRGWWRGPIVAVMNCEQIGDWNVAPRAHPNDGRLDAVEVESSMSLRQRLGALRRLPSGTHVPHPQITERRIETRTWEFDGPVGLWIDGVRRGAVARLTVRVEPDAFTLHV